jgi:hypothetical protein
MAKFLPFLLLAIWSAVLLSAATAQEVVASCFSDAKGNRNNNLNDGGYYYAELSTNYQARRADFRALGGLPNGHRLRISYNGRSILATKGDVGRGGPNNPKIDIHINAARALGFSSCYSFGIRTVTIESA